MLVVWIISFIIGLILVLKAEKVADMWRSTEFSRNVGSGVRANQLMRRNGFWKFIGMIIIIISIFLMAGGDDLFVDKSKDAILNSTPEKDDITI